MSQASNNRLAAVSLRNLPAGMHHDGHGLYLDVRGSESRNWIFRYQRAGRAHSLGLGPLHIVSLADARQRAREARRLLLDGTDPLEARRAARAAQRVTIATAMTFREAALAYIEAHRAGWRNPKHAAQWGSTLATYAFPVLGSLPVDAINTASVLKVLGPIWATKPETASRVRGRVEAVLDFAAARGERAGENPARLKGNLAHLLPARSRVARVEHHAALPYDELPGFMAELRAVPDVAARALELTILTAARSGAVLSATWAVAEIDLERATWLVPGSHMKSGKEHRTPLSEPAVAILRAISPPGGSVPSQRVFPVSLATVDRLLKRLRPGLTVHGFRSTFSDWTAEMTAFPSEVREMALAHAVTDKVEAAYRRGDLFQKRRALAEAWASYCDGAGAGKVVRLRAGG